MIYHTDHLTPDGFIFWTAAISSVALFTLLGATINKYLLRRKHSNCIFYQKIRNTNGIIKK